MSLQEREDDFEARGAGLRELADEELHARFWSLVDQVVEPLIEEARTHTSPSIERSVLLRMGFSSVEAAALVKLMEEGGVLGHGAGRLVLELSRKKGISVREAGTALQEGKYWEDLPL